MASYLSSLLLLLLQLGLEFVELFLGARGEGGGGLVSFGVLGWGVEGLEVGEEGKKGRGTGGRKGRKKLGGRTSILAVSLFSLMAWICFSMRFL